MLNIVRIVNIDFLILNGERYDLKNVVIVLYAVRVGIFERSRRDNTVCNEQTSLNYHATVDNQNKIAELEERIRELKQRIDMIEFYRRHER